MISGPVRSLELTEHQAKSVDASILTRTDALLLDSRFRGYVRISPTLSGATWDLTPGDWIGRLPISNDLVLYIQPKVPLQNVFGMLDVAYEARFEIPKGATECQSLEDFFDRLASILAKRCYSARVAGCIGRISMLKNAPRVYAAESICAA